MVQLTTLAALATAVVGVHSYGAPCPDDKCGKSATSYCSSYLGVSKKTVTSTSTAVITKYTSTKDVYGEPTTITSTITIPKVKLKYSGHTATSETFTMLMASAPSF